MAKKVNDEEELLKEMSEVWGEGHTLSKRIAKSMANLQATIIAETLFEAMKNSKEDSIKVGEVAIQIYEVYAQVMGRMLQAFPKSVAISMNVASNWKELENKYDLEKIAKKIKERELNE